MTTARLPLHSSAMDAGYQSQTRGSNKMKFSAGLSLNGSETESDTTTLGQVSVIKHTTSDTAMGNAIVLDAKVPSFPLRREVSVDGVFLP
jgi:hypothetical protein